MAEKTDQADLQLGEPASEAAWRALVEPGLKGAGWDKLIARTADKIAIDPLYREMDIATATDVSGFPGAEPFVRGARAEGPWLIRQSFAHPDPERTNRDILADLAGGVTSVELVIDLSGANGAAIRDAADLDLVLADVILEAAPVSLDAGANGLSAAELLAAKLKGAAGADVAFNLDPIGALMRKGAIGREDVASAARFSAQRRVDMPAASALRVDARPVHEAGGTQAQEIATALASGILYLRALAEAGLSAADANASLLFTLSVGPDVLIEAAKLRALRLCWARVMEASSAAPVSRAARIHAVTSRRMMTRYDAWTNILRVTTAALAAAIGGADAITTLPMTDALGLPTPQARRLARNTQHVLLEEARMGHVADPAGGSWFVEKLTRELANAAWAKMQAIEAAGGIVVALTSGALQHEVDEARTRRQQAVNTRRETITGVTDFPLLGAEPPKFEPFPAARGDGRALLAPIRWSAPFEALRETGETAKASVFFANIGTLAEFAPRANFARNLLSAGGVAAIGSETPHDTTAALVEAFRASGAKAAIICSTDARYADHATTCAQALKSVGANWVMLAGKPQDEPGLRAASVDQFLFAGDDAVAALTRLHQALGIGA